MATAWIQPTRIPLLLSIFLFPLACSFGVEELSVTFFVNAVKGSDSNNGTSPDLPFASLQAALLAVSEARGGGKCPSVVISEGTYFISPSEPLVLNQSTSGNASCTISISGSESGGTTVSGGRVVPLSSRIASGLMRKNLPSEVVAFNLTSLSLSGHFGGLSSGGLGQCPTPRMELTLNGDVMTVARYPNILPNGTWQWINVGSALNDSAFTISNDRVAEWASELDHAWLHGYWTYDWADNYVKPCSIRNANDTNASLVSVCADTPPIYGLKSRARFYGLNLLSELDAPGEYFIDETNDVLYLYPPHPLTTEDKLVLSVAESAITADTTSYLKMEYIAFENFQGTAVSLKNVNKVVLENLAVNAAGQVGISLSGYSSQVDNSIVSSTGCAGITLTGGDNVQLTASSLSATGNTLRYFSRVKRAYTPGIHFSGVGITLSSNKISDGPHNAILGGGSLNLFQYNYIARVCYEVTDSGAFYTGRSWANRGNIVHGNVFEDIYNTEHPVLGSPSVQAIYLDDEMSGYTIYNNTFIRCHKGIFVGGGRRNNVTKNIFFDNGVALHLDNRGMGWQASGCAPGGTLPQTLKAVNYQLPPWSTTFPEVVDLMSDHPCVPVYNNFADNACWGCTSMMDFTSAQAEEWLTSISNNVNH
uniref:Right handed beta helix domain-containing protein n=1 Tax=Palpitomonas bilix TaxID=652834 RepID=A0A7S3GKE4_9EUKA|mmetsp:Transcript_7317/g.18994  ORF Transcript_7317/g.18994 Transcript_7317/m.18994 type:complete len:648 (+) Transcript_7317:72-2015(+)